MRENLRVLGEKWVIKNRKGLEDMVPAEVQKVKWSRKRGSAKTQSRSE